MNEISRRLSPERRARIVDAARHLILRQGLRATTMEAIAREAKIAKPTLYGYFPDKEAVFAAIIQALVDDIRAAVDAALHGEGDVVARVGGALAAKYKVVAKLLEGSPHADELYSEHGRSAAAQFAAVEQADRGGDHRRAAAGRRRPAAAAGAVAAGQRLRHRLEVGDAGRDRAGDPIAGRAAGEARTDAERVTPVSREGNSVAAGRRGCDVRQRPVEVGSSGPPASVARVMAWGPRVNAQGKPEDDHGVGGGPIAYVAIWSRPHKPYRFRLTMNTPPSASRPPTMLATPGTSPSQT